MKTTKTQKRAILLSPLAFALTFGAYAEARSPDSFDAANPAERREVSNRATEKDSSEITWMINWLEKHGN